MLPSLWLTPGPMMVASDKPAFSVARTTMRNIKRWRDAQDHPALDRGQHGGRTQTVPAGDGERLFHPFSERLAQLVNSVGGSYS